MFAHFLLLLLFLLTIAHLVTLKICSVKLDHRTAPVFVSLWVLAGLAATAPAFMPLWAEGYDFLLAHPVMFALAAGKGVMLYVLLVVSQQLMQISLSSRHYVTPLAVGILSVCNSFLGEQLSAGQWASALGLCALAAAFFFKGHLADLDRKSRIHYALLVGISVMLGALDHALLSKGMNWCTLLAVSHIVLLLLAIALLHRQAAVWKTALFALPAVLAGLTYAATELVKFYQQVTINPVTAVVTVQASTKPVIMLLAALVWKERTAREQLVWGVLALLVMLPLFL
ncbi:MAG: hypothetical protein ACK4PK_03975 [Alphaproteobacteria bacterium]